MTSLSLSDVEQFAAERAAVMGRATGAAADVAVERSQAEVRAQFSRNGSVLLTPDILANVEARDRAQYDVDLLAELEASEAKQEALAKQLTEFAEAAGELPSAAAEWGAGTANFLAARQLEELETMNERENIKASGATLEVLTQAYEKSTDERDAVFVRLTEKFYRRGMIEALGVRFDGSVEATVAFERLGKTIAKRRAARVPEWVGQAQQKLAQSRTLTYTHVLGHLRSGQGLAKRPRSVA